jgi:serine protease Do
MTTAISQVRPALVRIHVVSVDYDGGREVKEEGYGSGVIISPDGYVITNHHVAGNATQISCTLVTKEEYDAVLVGTDALADIAVLRLVPASPRTFPFARFGDSSTLEVGDRVFAMGSPLAFSQSVTMGVISNTELVMPDAFGGDDGLTLDGEDVGSIVRWIGHDAKILPGNSGGPLVNVQGEIIGLNEISVGLSGAIPGNLAHSVALELIKHGKVTRSWLGILVQPLLKASTVKHGVLIADTAPASPAVKAGVQAGDILVRVNGQPVDVRFKEELPLFNQMAMALPIGKPVMAVVIRQGKEVTLTITPAVRPNPQPKSSELTDWGICASDLIPAMKTMAVSGALVTSTRTGGPAENAKPGLQAGDIIINVNDQPVTNQAALIAVTQSVLKTSTENPVSVVVRFIRDQEEYLTVVKVGTSETRDNSREVRKAWLPVGMQVLTSDLAAALHLDGRTGVRVTQVYPGTASAKAGLQVGDIIDAIDGVSVDASQPEDSDVFPTMIRAYKIGSTVELTVLRNGVEQKISVQLPEAPRLPREMPRYHEEAYDFTVRDIAFLDRMHNSWTDEQQGVLVEGVGEGGWAALGRLKAGDLLTTVNGVAVTGASQLATIMTAIDKDHPATITLQIKRDDQQLFLELQGSWHAGGVKK